MRPLRHEELPPPGGQAVGMSDVIEQAIPRIVRLMIAKPEVLGVISIRVCDQYASDPFEKSECS